jgi:hypothetical protein
MGLLCAGSSCAHLVCVHARSVDLRLNCVMVLH